MTKTEILTAAFEKGRKVGYAGKDGVPASLRFKGSAENFYWKGYAAGKEQYTTYINSAEYKAERQKQLESMQNLAMAVRAIGHGHHELARTILNEDLGMGIQ